MYARLISQKIISDDWTIASGEILKIQAKKDLKYIIKSEKNGKCTCVDEKEIELVCRPKFF